MNAWITRAFAANNECREDLEAFHGTDGVECPRSLSDNISKMVKRNQ